MKRATPVRLGIIGAGLIGLRHAALAKSNPDLELVGFAEPSAAAMDRVKPFDVPVYADAVGMIDAEKPDGVVISAPTQNHMEIGLACVDLGIPMLMEKPVTEDVASGRRLIDAAAQAGVPIAVGHHRRFDPAVSTARDMIQNGEIGRLLLGTAIWCQRKPDAYFDVEWRRKKGGGPVLTNLIHEVDLLRYLCGEVASVFAKTSNGVRGFEIEDTAAILYTFRNGATVSVLLSDAAQTPWSWERATGENPDVPRMGLDCFRFVGTKGGLDFPSNDLWRTPGAEIGSWSDTLERTAHETPERAAHRDQLDHFGRVVRGEVEPRVTGADGLASLAATVAVFRSAETGAPVEPEYRLD
ncbi:MAG: Gfo/Idh/MocA family oxidoreductase [Alphaproteobacteria bacterium]|nr:Gfo/Idh/MocA family oxidoreductase [Alphaproteobacteria bacterium]